MDKGLSKLTVSGYKSLGDPITINIKPLTILSGANSSGKSSIMQPLLLLKQTLESSFNPGTLVLDGSHLHFTNSNQIFTSGKNNVLNLEMVIEDEIWAFEFIKGNSKDPLKLNSMKYKSKENEIFLSREMYNSDVLTQLKISNEFSDLNVIPDVKVKWSNDLFFMYPKFLDQISRKSYFSRSKLTNYLSSIIHLAALRFTGKREYPKTRIENRIVGSFDHYIASILSDMKEFKLTNIILDMNHLNLTSDIITRRKANGQISVHVSRQKNGIPQNDLEKGKHVNIVDVGVGILQVLPIVVALRYAKQGQLVIIEQPEVHLHPKAQRLFCDLLIESAKRGVKVVLETHSQIILRGIQILVANKEISTNDVNLIWFSLNNNGLTVADEGQLNTDGAYLNWPTDFDDVILGIEGEYLKAGR